MKRWWHWLLLAFAVLGLAVISGLVFLVDRLPGPGEIAQAVGSTSVKPHETSDIGVPDDEAKKPAASAGATGADKAARDSKSQDNNKELVLELMNEDAADIRVCDNLGQSKLFEQSRGKKEMSFDDMFKDKTRTDPIAESLRIPIKAVFQDEEVSGLMKEIMAIDTSKMDRAEKDSLLKKLGFYTRAASTAASLLKRKKQFESLGDRAIHLSVLARIAVLKPEALESANLKGICEDLERSIVAGEKPSIKKEREKILSLLQDVGITPAEIQFDPHMYLNFDVQMNDNNVSFSLGGKEPSS